MKFFSTAPDRLEANARAIGALVESLSADQARWKPSDAEWSVVEVVSHLADEEVEDFRRRLEHTLERPDAEWPPIDPEGWAVERGYAGRDPQESLDRFLQERRRSVGWLRGLTSRGPNVPDPAGRERPSGSDAPPAPDWDRAHDHPRLGAIRAGDLLAAWLAHDLIHIRQITRLRHGLLVRDARPYDTAYAGSF